MFSKKNYHNVFNLTRILNYPNGKMAADNTQIPNRMSASCFFPIYCFAVLLFTFLFFFGEINMGKRTVHAFKSGLFQKQTV